MNQPQLNSTEKPLSKLVGYISIITKVSPTDILEYLDACLDGEEPTMRNMFKFLVLAGYGFGFHLNLGGPMAMDDDNCTIAVQYPFKGNWAMLKVRFAAGKEDYVLWQNDHALYIGDDAGMGLSKLTMGAFQVLKVWPIIRLDDFMAEGE
jgi:hypothetical protein